ncbi:MAG: IS200/IS605 family transposase [Candidatus Cloacimonetes bacterium]|nr:IS200/IS605 family transposase [Candidatus Cloacimonadota bacterium]
MANSFTQVYIHYIYNVQGRENALKTDIKDRLYPYLVKLTTEKKGYVVAINGMEDHVHMLVRLHPEISVSEFAKFTKANSSHWANETRLFPRQFYWQAGYGAFSVSQSVVEKVKLYIDTQSEHHRHMSAREEYEIFLQNHNIEYNTNYLPD